MILSQATKCHTSQETDKLFTQINNWGYQGNDNAIVHNRSLRCSSTVSNPTTISYFAFQNCFFLATVMGCKNVMDRQSSSLPSCVVAFSSVKYTVHERYSQGGDVTAGIAGRPHNYLYLGERSLFQSRLSHTWYPLGRNHSAADPWWSP